MLISKSHLNSKRGIFLVHVSVLMKISAEFVSNTSVNLGKLVLQTKAMQRFVLVLISACRELIFFIVAGRVLCDLGWK